MQRLDSASPAQRGAVLAYGIVSYLVGVAGLVALIAAFATLLPWGFLVEDGQAHAFFYNLALTAAWGFIHSGMARDSFKTWITRRIPEPAERATYVLVSGVTSILLVGLCRTVPGTVWTVTSPAGVVLLWGLFGFGWTYLLAATFAINHFDLFGLRQVYLHFRNQPRPPLRFVKRAMYRFSRHPIQTGVLIGSWATPVLSATHATVALGLTIYIFVGLWFEEKDLERKIGEPYRQYRREAGMFGPRLRGR